MVGSFARYLAAGTLAAALAMPARPCSLPSLEVLARKDARISERQYAGKQVTAFTMTLVDSGERGEYVSYLRGLGLGAYIVADGCGEQKCLDLYADLDNDGVLDAQYRIPYPRNVLARIPLFVRMFDIQRDVRQAFDAGGGRAGALRALESRLEGYRVHSVGLSQHQSVYADRLDRLRRLFCADVVVSGDVHSDGVAEHSGR